MNENNIIKARAVLSLPGLVGGIFLRRPNRFLAEVRLNNGEEVRAFVADPGRLKELFYPGAEVYLSPAFRKKRSTVYDLHLVRAASGVLVSVNSRVPNLLIDKALRLSQLQAFVDYSEIKTEPDVNGGRLDFLLRGASPPCYIEVKSCTLVHNNRALFPDAPTLRGQKHVKELISLKEKGYRAAVIFVVQREDAEVFSPHKTLDPGFSQALQSAFNSGVEVYAYRCRISFEQVSLDRRLPVDL